MLPEHIEVYDLMTRFEKRSDALTAAAQMARAAPAAARAVASAAPAVARGFGTMVNAFKAPFQMAGASRTLSNLTTAAKTPGWFSGVPNAARAAEATAQMPKFEALHSAAEAAGKLHPMLSRLAAPLAKLTGGVTSAPQMLGGMGKATLTGGAMGYGGYQWGKGEGQIDGMTQTLAEQQKHPWQTMMYGLASLAGKGNSAFETATNSALQDPNTSALKRYAMSRALANLKALPATKPI